MVKPRYILIVIVFTIPIMLFPYIIRGEEQEKSLYELIKSGTVEELRSACRKRSVSDSGDRLELQRRLLEHELLQGSVPFNVLVKDAQSSDIILNHSDFIVYMEDTNGDDLVLLSSRVDIVYDGKRITADEVKINVNTGIITGSGDITFTDNEKVYIAESFYYNVNTDEGYFLDASTTLLHFIYSGDIIRKVHESEKFVAENVSLTTCDLENPHYRIEAGKLYFYDESRVLIQNASFIYGNDILFRLPYFYKSLEEPVIKSSLYFRERSGVVSQNTYYPLKTDEKELKIKGDFYERLGICIGSDYSASYPSGGSTEIGVSAALSNKVYFYDEVTENWSPLGPPESEIYGVNRFLRYKLGLYQQFQFGRNFDNETELNFYWVADPYYTYDFERRKEKFDPFDLVGQAEYDYPRKGDGFSWFLNNYFYYNFFSLSIQNKLRFEPQRNTDVDEWSLPNYYEYRIYTLAAPDVVVLHQKSILTGIRPALFSDISYKSSVNYNHTLYYDEHGRPASELHRAGTSVSFEKDYSLSKYIKFTPEVEVGAQKQHHIEPDSTELDADRQNSLLYARTSENVTIGSPDLYFKLAHNLKYKFLGPADDYEYGKFRIHDISMKGYAGWWYLTEQIETSLDLRQTYYWEEARYEPFTLDKSRFTPLINTLTFTPVPVLSLSDKLVYDIAGSRFKTNSFILDYSSSALYLRDREITVNWNIDWEHNFVNPLLDTLRSIFGINAQIHRYWTLYFSVLSRNDDIWRYIPKSASERGVKRINPVVDLLKSFNFFNVDDRKASYFKMKGISMGFVHDLHDWEMRFDYTGNRELSFDGSKYLWNNTYSISIGLKEVEGLIIHREYNERR